MNTSNFYKNTGKIPLASKLSFKAREKMLSKFMKTMNPQPNHVVLDVGVTSDDQYPESNFFEKFYPYKDKIVCVGTEDGEYLEKKYPGIEFIKVYSGKPLPFEDKKFDIVFSNAVIEHVGSVERQRAFVKEIIRVSKSFFMTTPNGWFPVEFHTALPLLHWLPQKLHRKIIFALGEKFWSEEDNLNILTKREFLALFPTDMNVVFDSVSLFGYPTNLIIYGNSFRQPE
jgi:SAM-dependent methyltransferase